MTKNSAMACLLGSCDSWDMIRPIGLAGIRCALISEPDDYVRASRFANITLDRADSTSSPDLLFERLRSFSKTQPETPVLYYATDADLLFISRYRDQLSRSEEHTSELQSH